MIYKAPKSQKESGRTRSQPVVPKWTFPKRCAMQFTRHCSST